MVFLAWRKTRPRSCCPNAPCLPSGGLPNSINKGTAARVQFSNDLTTPVDVKVTGSWISN